MHSEPADAIIPHICPVAIAAVELVREEVFPVKGALPGIAS
jgi:hypothetical protein